MFRRKLSCCLVLLITVCVGLSQGGKIKLYDLMQNSDDDCFDKSGGIYKGKTCDELVEESRGYCYTSIEEVCCLSCSFKKQDVSGCEYGDKSFRCDAKLCGKYDKETRENICCETCDGYKSKQESKPSTQKPVTSTKSSHTSREVTETLPRKKVKKVKKPVKTFSFPVLRKRKGKKKSSIKHNVKVEKEPESKPIPPTTSVDKTAGWIDPDPLPVTTQGKITTAANIPDKQFKENYVVSHWEGPTTQEPTQPRMDTVADTVYRTGSITHSQNRGNTDAWVDPDIPNSLLPIPDRPEMKNSPSLSAPDMSSINSLRDTVLSMPSVEVEPDVPVVPVVKDTSPFDGSTIVADFPTSESSNNDLISPGFDVKPWDSYAAANSEGGIVSGPTASPNIPETNLEKKTVDLTNNPVKILKAPVPEPDNEYAAKDNNVESQVKIITSEEPNPPVIPIPPHVVEVKPVTDPIVYDKPVAPEETSQVENVPFVPVVHNQVEQPEVAAPIPDPVIMIKGPKKTEASPAVKNILENFINPNEPNASPNVEQNVLPIIPGPNTLGVSVTVDPLALPVDLETAIVEGISLRDAMIKIPKEALTVNNPAPSVPFFGSNENSLHMSPDVSKIKKNIEILPLEPPPKDVNVIPVENTFPVEIVEKAAKSIPVEKIVPVESVLPVNPVENIVPVVNHIPVENVVPVENVLPVENIVPVENIAPVEKVLPSVKNVIPVENVVHKENVVPAEKLPINDNAVVVSDKTAVENVMDSPISTTNEIHNSETIEVKGSGDVKKTFLIKTVAKPTSTDLKAIPVIAGDGLTIPPPHTVIIQQPFYMPPYAPWFYSSDRSNNLYNSIRAPIRTPVFVRKTKHFKIVRTPKTEKKKKVTKAEKIADPVQSMATWNSLHPPVTPKPSIRMFSTSPVKSQSISDDDSEMPSPPVQQRRPMVQRQQSRSTVNQNVGLRHQTRTHSFQTSQIMQPRHNNQQMMATSSNSIFNRHQVGSRNQFNSQSQPGPYNTNHPLYRPQRVFVHHVHSFNYPNMNNMQHWQNMNNYMPKRQSMNMNHLPFWYNGRW